MDRVHRLGQQRPVEVFRYHQTVHSDRLYRHSCRLLNPVHCMPLGHGVRLQQSRKHWQILCPAASSSSGEGLADLITKKGCRPGQNRHIPGPDTGTLAVLQNRGYQTYIFSCLVTLFCRTASSHYTGEGML